MKKHKKRLLTELLCIVLLGTDIMSSGIQVSAVDLQENSVSGADESVSGNDGLAEEETITSDVEFEGSAEEMLALMTSDDDIASGYVDEDYGHIAWVIDVNGKLTVKGTGDYDEPNSFYAMEVPWDANKNSIISAEINVTDMKDSSSMFYGCYNLISVDVSGFDTTNITDMRGMFYKCRSLERVNISSFNTSNVTNMSEMFYGCRSLTSLDAGSFNTDRVTDMNGMFCGCIKLTSLNVSSFNTSNVTDMKGMFSGCDSLTSLDVSSFDTGKVTDMSWMFSSNILDEEMVGTFTYKNNLKSLDLSNFNTKNVTNMQGMFYCCTSLTNLDVSGFDTGSVTNMGDMFEGCFSLTSLDVSNFNTCNVTDMGGMFCSCTSLTSLDVSNFNTYNVTDMDNMFFNCGSLASLDVRNFNTNNVTYMDGMFSDCISLTELDLSSFNVSKLISFKDVLSSNLTTIYTPYNLNVEHEVILPAAEGDIWYRSDGKTITRLPQNLSYSIALGRNHIPEEKEDSIGKLINSGTSIFLFRDKMTGAAIKTGSVCIGEDYNGKCEYYPSDENGYIQVNLGKDCKQIYFSTRFDQYEKIGGWAELDNYCEDSGIYVFYVKPKTDKYVPKLPSMNSSVETSGPTVETDEGSIDLFNMNMEFSMDFGKGIKSKVVYNENSKTIQVAFSAEEKKLDYDAIKNEFKTPESKSLNKQLENLENAQIMNTGKVSSVDVKLSVEGYVEFGQNAEFIEGGVTVKLKGSGNTEYRPTCTAGFAYAKYEMGISAQGKIKFTYVGGNISYAASLKLQPYGTIAVGAGWSLAHAEIGATGRMQIELKFPYINNQESISINAAFGLYGEVKFFCIGKRRTTEVVGNIWPATSLSDYTALSYINSEVSSDKLSEGELSMLPRDYLASDNKSEISKYNAENQSNLTPSDSFRYSEISEDKGVFEENNVQYARLGDGTEILAWIHDFGDKSSADRTTLVYSVNKNDGSGWSSIMPVCADTSTGDYYPDMIAKGDRAYLVWNKASKVFGDQVNEEDICKNMDVYAAVFENGAFCDPQMISDADNGLVEFSPIVAADGNKAAAAWMINSENDYHYTKGKNSIYVCEYDGEVWSRPVSYAQNLNYVSDYDVDYVNGSAAVLYAEDADNIPATQDGCVYYIKDNKKAMVADDSYNAEIVGFCDGKLYFSGGNKVYKAAAGNLSNIYDTGIDTSNFKVIKNAAGAETVMFLRQDGYKSNVYASYYRNGIYTAPVPIAADDGRVTNYSPVYNEDGTISIAYDEQEILENADYIYGLTDMVVKKNVKPDFFFVDSDLTYNTADVVPGNIIEFTAAVSNYTAGAVSKVKVSLEGSKAGELYTDILDLDIPVGERRNVSLPYTLPDNIINQRYTLTVIPMDFEDPDLSDNCAGCELGFSDIMFEDLKINDHEITGKIINAGYQTAEKVSLTVKEDSQENDPLAMMSYEGVNLAPGESWEFSYQVQPAVFQNVGDVKYYLLLAETDSFQNNYSNDSGIVCSGPKAPDDILFEQNTLTMTEKTAAVVKATVLPENTAFKNVIYTSSDNSVAVVDSEGNIYATGKGNAVITAYTMDLSLKTECMITVEGLEEETYTLSNRGLELQTGDESSLYVMDKNGNKTEGVIWSSTDENIVSINQDGTVLAKGEGIACLTANIDTFVDVCIVRVSNRSIVQLACDETFLYLTKGETARLQITVVPENTTMDKTLTYVSEDETVATVNASGLVTAVQEGNTLITISSINGINKKIEIEVKPPVIYTVAFDTMGGTRVDPVQITADKTVSEDNYGYTGYLPSIPETCKEGYVFEGWYADKNGNGEALSMSTPITGDIIYYAKWRPSGSGEDPDGGTGDVLPGDIPADGIPDGLWIAGLKDYTYTGKAIKPSLRVYYNNKRLKEDQDYTVKYKNNIKAAEASNKKAPTVTIKGKGNFAGTASVKFAIKQAQLTEEHLFAASIYPPGTRYTPAVILNGNILKIKTDYTITYFQYIDNTEDTGNDTNIQKLSKQPVKEGSYCMQIAGKGSCNGIFTFDYTIASDKNSGTVSISGGKAVIGGMIYGDNIPIPTLNVNGELLTPDTDYKVTFSNTNAKGTATAVFIGIGNYCGTLKKTFKVKAAPLPEGCVTVQNSVSYEKGGAQPEVSVVIKDNVSGEKITLIKGKDYTVSCKNNKKLGDTAVVTVKGRGNYTGSCSESFSITAKDLNSEDMRIYVSDAARGKKPAVTVYDSNGKKLASGSDYKAMINETEHTVEIIPGKNNLYTGTRLITYEELDADKIITSVKLDKYHKIFTYTGGEITLEKDWLTVKAGKKQLSANEFEIIGYVNNIEKGTATVIIQGINGYSGTKQINFKIKSHSMPSVIEWFASLFRQ